MNTTESNTAKINFQNYVSIHNFMHPEEPLKAWINEENFIDLYKSDWNELMPAINNITVLTEFQDYEFNSLFWEIFCQLDIEEVYTQVVLFINWYNEQKS